MNGHRYEIGDTIRFSGKTFLILDIENNQYRAAGRDGTQYLIPINAHGIALNPHDPIRPESLEPFQKHAKVSYHGDHSEHWGETGTVVESVYGESIINFTTLGIRRVLNNHLKLEDHPPV